MTDAKPITEQAAPDYRGIDTWDAPRILHAILQSQQIALANIQPVIPAMAVAAEAAADRLKNPAGRIIYIGAGTPARLAVQDAVELTPTFGWSDLRVAFVIAGGEQALTRAIEGAEDNPAAAIAQITALNVTPADVCIAISASGTTPFTVEGCRAARKAGALTISIYSNPGADLELAADHPVLTDSGPEPVAGSTRMNAGTAQAVALKMISTLVMIRLGHVYDGYMVDMQQNNDKLRRRAARMVCDITGCTENDADTALNAADGNVKLAVLVTTGLSAEEGKALLGRSGQNLRTALQSLKS